MLCPGRFILVASVPIQNILKSPRKYKKCKKNAEFKKVSEAKKNKRNEKERVLRSPIFAKGTHLALFLDKLSGALVAVTSKKSAALNAAQNSGTHSSLAKSANSTHNLI